MGLELGVDEAEEIYPGKRKRDSFLEIGKMVFFFQEGCRTCERASSWISGGLTKGYGLRSHREQYMSMLVMD